MRRVVALAFMAMLLSACSEPLEFADWTMPVPEGTRILEYAGIPVEQREHNIEVVETLRVGAGDDLRYSFYRPTDLAVASDGRLYVLDAGNHRIQVFDADGVFVTTIGREGGGPGEIQRRGQLVVTGNVLVRVGDDRISSWTLAGELIEDSSIAADGGTPAEIAALPDGTVVATFSASTAQRSTSTTTTSFIRVRVDGTQGHVYARLTGPQRTITLFSDRGFTIIGLPTPAPWVTVSRSGDVYVTNADEYQVLAMNAEGKARWALRTAWPRLPMTDEDRARAVLRGVDGLSAADLDVAWPTHNPALANGGAGDAALYVDGHGHLYVFPFIRDQEGEVWPVDVYDADGEPLFSGQIGVPGWWDAAGDFVYRFEEDAATEERIVIRYRLVEPFE